MKKIPLQAPPDFSSMVPPDVSGEEAPPTSPGMEMNDLSPDQANSIPDSGEANVGFTKVHHRSEKHIHPDGSTTEKHHVKLNLTHFHPHKDDKEEDKEEEAPKSKKIQRNAQQAVADHFGP